MKALRKRDLSELAWAFDVRLEQPELEAEGVAFFVAEQSERSEAHLRLFYINYQIVVLLV